MELAGLLNTEALAAAVEIMETGHALIQALRALAGLLEEAAGALLTQAIL
jgi:hypothetical protein